MQMQSKVIWRSRYAMKLSEEVKEKDVCSLVAEKAGMHVFDENMESG